MIRHQKTSFNILKIEVNTAKIEILMIFFCLEFSEVYFEYQLQAGVILAFDYYNNNLLWTSSINNPIAAVWELKNGQLKEKSLLKTRRTNRIAFMGKFNSIPYVIISSRIQRQLTYHARKATG